MINVVLSPVSIPELVDLIASEVESRINGKPKEDAPSTYIKGIHNLAKFLDISPARAQKLKNDGLLPYWQSGRLVYFDATKVREAMDNYKPMRRSDNE